MKFFSRIFGEKPRIYQQRQWTEAELVAQGFLYYPPIKRVTMVRRLPKEEAPKVIKTAWDTITATAGYYIAYVAGTTLKAKLDDYEPRPLEPHIFETTYKLWDEQKWKPNPTEKHLMQMGCKPYYKIAGVWAKKLKHDTYVQSIESSKPSLIPTGAWLCVGTSGEPWSVTEDWFRTRYQRVGVPSSQAVNR